MGSSRWVEAVIGGGGAATMTPEGVIEYIELSPFHVFGGSFHGHAGKRGKACFIGDDRTSSQT